MATPTLQYPVDTKDPDEVLRGAEAIGAVLGSNKHQAFHHLKQGHIRGVRKMGRLWIGIRRNIILQTVSA
jgi:hypothetical protein